MEDTDELRWRKSTYSSGNGAECVEVGQEPGVILVRDTKDAGAGPVHRFRADEWRAFIAGIRDSEFGR